LAAEFGGWDLQLPQAASMGGRGFRLVAKVRLWQRNLLGEAALRGGGWVAALRKQTGYPGLKSAATSCCTCSIWSRRS
jgi:hypothetical protein